MCRFTSRWAVGIALSVGLCAAAAPVEADYTNFESSHVHPMTLTPSGDLLLAVNTPDALLEVFAVQADGDLVPRGAIRVGLEPVTVVARSDDEAWVVNNLSDTISIVDLDAAVTMRTLDVGDEPTDVVFTQGKAFVSVSQADAVEVYDLSDLGAPPDVVQLFSRDIRALEVSADGLKVYAVALRSGNQTTVINARVILQDSSNMSPARLTELGLSDIKCSTPPPALPGLPAGIVRNPALPDPPPNPPLGNQPPVGLIVKWNDTTSRWEDDANQDWNECLQYRMPDHDLFVIDATPPFDVTEVDHLGTSLFDVSLNPGSGKIFVPNTDARNFVRFEHPLGVQGHIVENRFAVVDPANANAVTVIDLNTHIDRMSDPATNQAERTASISQPGMLVWNNDGSTGYLTAIGSRKVFEVDGACMSGSCIFGTRATPNAVEVGEGPTGVALHEAKSRLYVLNRISHSVAIVNTLGLTKIDEIPLHDPSSMSTRDGRRFLYDGIDTSGHGDAACASCHISGDTDGLSWDLGDPTGDMVLYSETFDNVRFIAVGGVSCEPGTLTCTPRTGFDPQKGPMTTQTFRGMLEPLHWRGDRPTMRDFNGAFVGLMGVEDISSTETGPAGLSAGDMDLFRQFALQITYPPNPYRNVDDTSPCGIRATDPTCEVDIHGALFPGNPTEGDRIFHEVGTDGGGTCQLCHSHPAGTAGGTLGGLEPQEPTSMDAPALMHGLTDQSFHNDLKVAHLRNMYDKFGPVWPASGVTEPSETYSGFGYLHDGSMPDLYHFLTLAPFAFPAPREQVIRDVAAFLFHFPTETKPATGRQVTVPEGTPPTGSVAEEALLTTLLGLGDLADSNRHCELVAAALEGGRERSYHLSGGSWVTDVATEPAITTTALRQAADAPITFTCTPLGSGPRLGGDRDEDAVLDGDDCTLGGAGTSGPPVLVDDLTLAAGPPTLLQWTEQLPVTGPAIRYDVLGGSLSDLRTLGLAAATICVAGDVSAASFGDASPDPSTGEGLFYLLGAENACDAPGYGPNRSVLDAISCTAP